MALATRVPNHYGVLAHGLLNHYHPTLPSGQTVIRENPDMRLLLLPVAALVGLVVGCNKSPEGGTPGTAASFKLSLPTSELAFAKPIKQDTSEMFDCSIDRGSDFKKDVKLKVEGPAKLDVKLSKDTIKASDGDTKFNVIVKADKDAPVGEHSIKVTGTPDGGSATSQEFKVKVTAP